MGFAAACGGSSLYGEGLTNGNSNGPDDVLVSVDVFASTQPISPLIYGISASGGAEAYYKDMGISIVRWGGNARTRYNWEINASNAAADWEFRNLEKGDLTPGSAALDFHQFNAAAGAKSLIAVPLIGWVAKDRNPETRSLATPDSVGLPITPGSDAIRGYDPAENRGRTSVASFARKPGPFEYPPDLSDGSVYQDEWIDYLRTELGDAQSGGVQFFEMDNEPMLWSDTHIDVRPAPVGFDSYLDLFLEYAGAVNNVDATAQILGPSVWGWTAYFYSALDKGNDNYSSAADRKNHGGLPFLPWFLSQVSQHDSDQGRRSLDYLSVHYFPQGGVFSDDISELAQAKRLRSTRSLWDPTYQDDSWISRTGDGPDVRLILRLREWIRQYYPGTKLAITEWNWGAEDHITGGLAAADVLGIFGKEGVDLATHWGAPDEGSPVYWAYRMFRNYDGQGHGFGDLSVPVEITRTDQVSAYGSVDADSSQLKLIMINKSPSASHQVRLELQGIVPPGDVRIYQYRGAAEGIVENAPLKHDGPVLSYELPPYSITIYIVDLASGEFGS